MAYIVADRKFMGVEYEVKYTDRTEVDFRSDGQWESVERKYAPVPAAIVPKQISDFVAANELFGRQFIKKIERDPYVGDRAVGRPGDQVRHQVQRDRLRRLTIRQPDHEGCPFSP